MSLRARLLAILVALAALGLALGGASSYAALRSYLLDRVDKEQVPAALGQFSRDLDDPDEHGHRGGPPGIGGRAGGPGRELPAGTYGEQRDSSGKVVGTPRLIDYGGTAKAPALPVDLPLSEPGDPQIVSVGDYRVMAARSGALTTVVAVSISDVKSTLNRLLAIEALVAGGVLLLLAALALWLVRLGLAPLERMGRTAGAIAGGDYSRRVEPADHRTEVGRLGLAPNSMLAQIERAFAERRASEDRLRRFLSDASHELRTPLASIRGYAELFRIGAASEPADTAKAMSRIEDESARMGVLVEDLLTLARLDEERALVREDVDLARLTRDAAHDASAAAPDRTISVHGDDEVIVNGDTHRLRQVLANLVRNALVHTPAGTAVELSVRRGGAEAVLEIADHGPGLPAGDTAALFDRFWRTEGGRGRGKAGAGLGLAIVAGIVHAHGGSVSASTAPEGGALFTVRLPTG